MIEKKFQNKEKKIECIHCKSKNKMVKKRGKIKANLAKGSEAEKK